MWERSAPTSTTPANPGEPSISNSSAQGVWGVVFGGKTHENHCRVVMLNLSTRIPRYMDLCYTVVMNTDQHIWWDWARILQRWGMDEWAASFLEAAGPLTVLGAQLVYVGQPLLGSVLPEDHLDALARTLEDSSHTRDFVTFLREAMTS